MAALPGLPDVYSVGVNDPELRTFDVIMQTQYGTTYNAFLLDCGGAWVLFEAVKHVRPQFWLTLKANLEAVLNGADIDYVVINHTEPDHSGNVIRVAEVWPNVTLVGTPTACSFHREIANAPVGRKLRYHETSHLEEMRVGRYTLRFVHAPMLHWPDTQFSYIVELRTLVTVDFFGAHFSTVRIAESPLDAEDIDVADSYLESWRYYYECIMGPFPGFVRKGLQKICALGDVENVLVAHGPLFIGQGLVKKALAQYEEWSVVPEQKNRVVIVYVSAYGFTGEIATSIVLGLKDRGVEAIVFDLTGEPRYTYEQIKSALELLPECKGLLIGSPTIVGDALPPIWRFLTHLSPFSHAHLVASAFGSYGWSGEAVPNIMQRLGQLRLKGIPPLRIMFRPSPSDLKDAREFGIRFAEILLGKATPVSAVSAAAMVISSQQPIAQDSPPLMGGKVKKWRCVVCGEIFWGDKPPEICPACGASEEYFVEVKDEDDVYLSAAHEYGGSVVIIGGGCGAFSCAKSLRKYNKKCKITVLSDETVLPYYRPMVSDVAGDPEVEQKPEFWLTSEDWLKENDIDLKMNATATSIDRVEKTVSFEVEQGSSHVRSSCSLNYDRLVLATGARNFVPPKMSEFADCENFFTLRTLEDGRRLFSAVEAGLGKPVVRVVIVGGGILALECASALSELSVKVRVDIIEALPRLQPRQLTTTASQILCKIVERRCAVHLGSSVSSLNIDKSNTKLVESVVLPGEDGSGALLMSDIVICSIGVRANVGLALDCGLVCHFGIKTDEFCVTSDPNIYAVGDCAECGMTWVPSWPNASKQGSLAAWNILTGNTRSFESDFFPHLLTAFDHCVMSVGDHRVEDAEVYSYMERRNPELHSFAQVWADADQRSLRGILIGDEADRSLGKRSLAMIQGVNQAKDIYEVFKDLHSQH